MDLRHFVASGGQFVVWAVNGSRRLGYRLELGHPVPHRREPRYAAGGLQLDGLDYTVSAGSVAPGAGNGVTITPIAAATQNAIVTGPAAPLSIGGLVIQGTNGYTASLALTSGGSLSATSVSVLAGGARMTAQQRLRSNTPSLAVGGGNVSLATPRPMSPRRPSARRHLSLTRGNVGTLSASGGITTVASAGNADTRRPSTAPPR